MPPVPGSVPFRVTSGTEKNGRGVLGKDAAVKVRASLSRQDFSDKNEKSLVLCNGRYKSRRDGGCLGFRREPRCPLRCWKSQKASRRGSRSAGLGRQDLGARDASPATVCLNTSGCFFRQFLFTVFIDWRGEGSASAIPPTGSLSSPAGPRARHRGKLLLLLRPRQGKVRRCCQSGRLAPGRIRAGSSDRRENTTASLRGQPARSWGFREPPKLLGRKGTHSSQLVSQRDSYALAPTPAGNRDVGGVSPNPALHLAGLWRPFRRHFHVHQACHPPNSLRDVDGATAATSTALWERNA